MEDNYTCSIYTSAMILFCKVPYIIVQFPRSRIVPKSQHTFVAPHYTTRGLKNLLASCCCCSLPTYGTNNNRPSTFWFIVSIQAGRGAWRRYLLAATYIRVYLWMYSIWRCARAVVQNCHLEPPPQQQKLLFFTVSILTLPRSPAGKSTDAPGQGSYPRRGQNS